MEENVRVCDICGCEIKEEDGTWVDDQFLCQECVDEHCTTCDHCGETIWIVSAVEPKRSIARSIVSSLLSMGKCVHRFWIFTRQGISRP